MYAAARQERLAAPAALLLRCASALQDAIWPQDAEELAGCSNERLGAQTAAVAGAAAAIRMAAAAVLQSCGGCFLGGMVSGAVPVTASVTAPGTTLVTASVTTPGMASGIDPQTGASAAEPASAGHPSTAGGGRKQPGGGGDGGGVGGTQRTQQVAQPPQQSDVAAAQIPTSAQRHAQAAKGSQSAADASSSGLSVL